MNEYNIDLHDSKGRESKVIVGEFASDADIAKSLLQAIETARAYGYCRVTLDIALNNRLQDDQLVEPGLRMYNELVEEEERSHDA